MPVGRRSLPEQSKVAKYGYDSVELKQIEEHLGIAEEEVQHLLSVLTMAKGNLG